jgi:hypothetical protein
VLPIVLAVEDPLLDPFALVFCESAVVFASSVSICV